jgi:hypothetical protein
MNFLDSSSKNPVIPNFMKIRPLTAELFHADGRTNWQKDMMKLIVAFFGILRTRQLADAFKTVP